MVKRSDEILTGAAEVAAFLGWHVNKLRYLAAKYPPGAAGHPSHVSGRWDWTRTGALAWRDYVAEQESRHPEARRRFRPPEPPEVAAIRARREPASTAPAEDEEP